jgi:hypothetical protein
MQNLASVHTDIAYLDDLDLLDEISVIRTRVDVDSFITCNAHGDDPLPVYFELMGRRVFLGVLFPSGVIASDDWERDMLAASIPECLVTSTFSWLADRAL